MTKANLLMLGLHHLLCIEEDPSFVIAFITTMDAEGLKDCTCALMMILQSDTLSPEVRRAALGSLYSIPRQDALLTGMVAHLLEEAARNNAMKPSVRRREVRN